MSDRIKFTVYRDTWMRGCAGKLFSEGKRCCLRFLGNACGIPDTALSELGEPEEASPENWPETIVTPGDDETSPQTTTLCQYIIGVNDDTEITDETREPRLIEYFDAAGVDVEFLDTTPAEAEQAKEPTELPT